MKKELIIAVTVVLFIVLFIIAGNIYNNQQNTTLTDSADYLVRDYSPKQGPVDAKVTIVEFFDPACETCRTFHPFVKQLMDENPGKVNLVLRYLPLHQGSDVIVSIFEAARLQNRLWETLDLAFKTQNTWVVHHQSMPQKFWVQLGGIGLNMKRLEKDLQSEEIYRRIRQDLADAEHLQVTKTPGFFVNGKPLVNFGYKQLRKLVESEVSKNY